tara:strand:- start:31 stop:492 length:462 start_codon:yes stop_codon:yes gene_type:complete
LKNIFRKYKNSEVIFAKLLGFGGLIPFIIGLIILNFNINKSQVLEIVIIYAYTIIAFLGGIYWGVGLNIKVIAKRYFFISTLPTILIFISLLFSLSQIFKLIYLIVILNFFLYLEFYFFKKKLSKWFLDLRIKLNISLTVLLTLIILSMYLSI